MSENIMISEAVTLLASTGMFNQYICELSRMNKYKKIWGN